MKAMILAAGLGTRLRPLTDKKPKALIPVVNQPVIYRIIEYLKAYGIDRIMVNAHHHSQQVLDYLNGGSPFGLEIDVRVEPEILGTGGGIKNTSDFWGDEPFIVINSDILTNVNLERAYEHHRKSGNLATLILHDCEPFNQILSDANQKVTDIAPKSGSGRLAFTGIHIIEPELLPYIPERKYSDIIDCYRQLIRSGKSINACISTGHYWHDIGTVSSYVRANRELLEESFSVGPECHMDSSVKLKEWAIVGGKNHLEENVEIRRSILWEEVSIKRGIKVTDSIVTSFREIERDMTGKIF